MDYLVVGEQFARGGDVVEEFLVGGQHRFYIHRVKEFEPLRSAEHISMDSYIAVAPEGCGYHKVVHQIETVGIGIGLLEQSAARVLVLPFPSLGCASIEVDGKCSNRFGEDSHARPDCREV